jgi:hypothetical protein
MYRGYNSLSSVGLGRIVQLMIFVAVVYMFIAGAADAIQVLLVLIKKKAL